MIGSIIGATAPLFAKFLLDKVNKIMVRIPADSETIRLKEEVEALKNTLESKERASITESEVELVKEKFKQTEALQRRYKLEVLSDEVFSDWENRLRDKDEDRAIIVMHELESLPGFRGYGRQYQLNAKTFKRGKRRITFISKYGKPRCGREKRADA